MAIRLRCLVPSFEGMRVCKRFAFIGESLLASQRLDLSLNLPKQNKSNQIKPSVACISKIEFREGSMHQIIDCLDTTTVLGASLILRMNKHIIGPRMALSRLQKHVRSTERMRKHTSCRMTLQCGCRARPVHSSTVK